MQRLGYTRYVAQGGDWGAIVADLMAVPGPEGLLGIHTNMPGVVPPDDLTWRSSPATRCRPTFTGRSSARSTSCGASTAPSATR